MSVQCFCNSWDHEPRHHDLAVLDGVPHTHPAGFPCLACGRDAAKAAVADDRARIGAAVEALPWTRDDRMVAMHRAVLDIIDREDA